MRIQTNDTLVDLENKLGSIIDPRSKRDEIIHLPRRLGNIYFKDVRLCNFIIKAAASLPNLKIRDYQQEWPVDHLPAHFNETLNGVTSALFPESLENARGGPIPIEYARDVFRKVIRRGGLLQDDPFSKRWSDLKLGNKISICCFDPNNTEPRLLKGLAYKLIEFQTLMLDLRAHLDGARRKNLKSIQQSNPNARLMRFLFEIYQNAYEHGQAITTATGIKGIRFIHMRKHIGNKQELLGRARGFPELQNYIHEQIPRAPEKEHRFYEMSVSDSGLGILEGFLSSVRETGIKFEYDGDDRRLLEKLLFMGLTSKIDNESAGWGLFNALEAASEAGGFVTIRTGRHWLYRSFGADSPSFDSEKSVSNVLDTIQWPEFIGTQISLLLPLPILPT